MKKLITPIITLLIFIIITLLILGCAGVTPWDTPEQCPESVYFKSDGTTGVKASFLCDEKEIAMSGHPYGAGGGGASGGCGSE